MGFGSKVLIGQTCRLLHKPTIVGCNEKDLYDEKGIIDFNDVEVFSPRLKSPVHKEFKKVTAQLLVIGLLIGSVGSHAQQSLHFTIYDVDDGLANMTCKVLGQDSSGFLWIGMQPLMRFDGYNFKTFPTDPADPDNNPVAANCMADDGRGHLLFTNKIEVTWYNPDTGFIEPIRENGQPIKSELLEYGENSEFWCLDKDELVRIKMPEQKIERFAIPAKLVHRDNSISCFQSNNLWFSTGNGCVCFNTVHSEFHEIINEVQDEKYTNDRRFFKAKNNRLFFLHSTKLFSLTDNEADGTVVFDIESIGLKNKENCYSLICSRNGRFAWVHGTNKNLFKIEIETGNFREYSYAELIPSSIPNPTTVHLYELFNGDVCISAWDIGTMVFNPRQESFQPLTIGESYSCFLPYDPSMGFSFQSSDQVLWLAGSRVGLVKVEFSMPLMSTHRQTNFINGIVTAPNVRTIEELDAHSLFYSTFEEVSRFDRNTHTFSPIPRPEDGSPFMITGGIRFMVKDKYDNLYLHGWDNDILYLDYKNKRTIHIAALKFDKPLPSPSNTLFLDSKENLWFGGGTGMTVINTSNFTDPDFTTSDLVYVKEAHRNDLPVSAVSTGISESVDNKIWIGRFDGLYIYDYSTDTYTKQNIDARKPDLGVITILRASDERMWIGTRGGGLKVWNQKDQNYTSYSIKDGLPDNVIYSIEEDERGNLWMGTNKGICRFNPKNRTCKTYTEKDGIQNYEYNGNSSGKTRDGWIAMGGINGFNFFHPDSMNQSAKAPPIVFTEFSVQGESRPYLDSEIHLDYDENNFSFEFAALDYFRNQENQYAYKMDGIDKDWVMCGNRRFVSYPNMNPGTYTLHVKACNSYSVWNENGISKTIVIAAPWWGKWWFRTLVVLLFLSVVYVLYRYRLAQQTKLLTVRNTIASDLHDEIGSTLSSISLSSAVIQRKIHDTNPEVKRLLQQIGNNTDNMMEAMSDIVWTINAKNDRFENVVNRMRAFAIEIMEPLDCAVHFDVSENMLNLRLGMKQRKNLYLIFKEAVNNSAKYSGSKNLWVTFSPRPNGAVILAIRDDGKGFSTTAKETGHVSTGGNGIYNMKKRAEEIQGKLLIASQPGDGTTIELLFSL